MFDACGFFVGTMGKNIFAKLSGKIERIGCLDPCLESLGIDGLNRSWFGDLVEA